MTRGVLLSLVLFAGSVRAAEPERIADCTASSRVLLGDASTRAVHEVCVSPEQPTTLVFDSPIAWGAVKVEPEGRLADWAQGRESRLGGESNCWCGSSRPLLRGERAWSWWVPSGLPRDCAAPANSNSGRRGGPTSSP